MPNIEWNQKGDHFLGNNEFEQAIKCYDIAIKLDPNDFEAYNEKGNAYLGLSEFRSAAEAFKKAYEMNSSFFQAIVNIGLAYSVSKQHEEALVYYDKIISLGNTQYLSPALNNKGRSLIELNRPKEALISLNQSIAINPSFYPPYDAKHDCLDKQGKYEDCLNNLNEALRFISDQDCTNKIQCFRGETFNKLERYEEALTVCDLVIRNDDLYGDAYVVKTEALRMLNRLDEAEECYEMAFSGDCNFTNSNTKIYFVPT